MVLHFLSDFDSHTLINLFLGNLFKQQSRHLPPLPPLLIFLELNIHFEHLFTENLNYKYNTTQQIVLNIFLYQQRPLLLFLPHTSFPVSKDSLLRPSNTLYFLIIHFYHFFQQTYTCNQFLISTTYTELPPEWLSLQTKAIKCNALIRLCNPHLGKDLVPIRLFEIIKTTAAPLLTEDSGFASILRLCPQVQVSTGFVALSFHCIQYLL